MSSTPFISVQYVPPFLRMVRHNHQVVVHTPTTAHLPAVPLTRIPGIHIGWLKNASHLFWLERRRCISFVLLFTPATGKWTFDLPRQTCHAAGSDWSFNPDSLPALPAGAFVAGSFQSRAFLANPNWGGGVPSYSGFHFIHCPDPQSTFLCAILRCDDPADPLLIDSSEAVSDDHESLIQAYENRVAII